MKKSILIIGLFLFAATVCNAQKNDTYDISNNYIASGYMGDIKNIMQRKNFQDNSRPDSLCIKITYSPGDRGFGGLYWQYPADNWCEHPGKDFSKEGYTKITFYTKGENGGEEVKFKFGQDCDSIKADEMVVILKKTWQKYSINIEGENLSNITGGFCWLVESKSNNGAVTFYLDDIVFEK